MRAVLAAVACGLVALAACDSASNAPPPWTTGTRIHTQVYADEHLTALAGRVDTMLGFACPVDPRNAPAFADCPREAWLVYRDEACTQRDIIIGKERPAIDKYATASADGVLRYYEVTEPYLGTTVTPDDMGTCTVPSSGEYPWVGVEIAPELLKLGTSVDHSYDGVPYTTLETDDGFSVITNVDGATPVIEATPGRIQARYEQRGAVRKYVGLYGSELGINCLPAVDTTGQIRCVPDRNDHLMSCDEGGCGNQLQTCASESGLHAELGPADHDRRPTITRVMQCEPSAVPMYNGRPTACMSAPMKCSPVSVDTLPVLSLELE